MTTTAPRPRKPGLPTLPALDSADAYYYLQSNAGVAESGILNFGYKEGRSPHLLCVSASKIGSDPYVERLVQQGLFTNFEPAQCSTNPAERHLSFAEICSDDRGQLFRPSAVAEMSDQAPVAAELATNLSLIYEIEKGDALLEHKGADAREVGPKATRRRLVNGRRLP